MTDARRFYLSLAKLASVYRVPVDDVLVETYWEVLRPWPIESLEAGAREWLRTETWMPKPVQWADAARDWLRDQDSAKNAGLLAIEASNAPPLKSEEVKAMVAELVAKLGLPR